MSWANIGLPCATLKSTTQSPGDEDGGIRTGTRTGMGMGMGNGDGDAGWTTGLLGLLDLH